jgi:anti-sigma B factor antagonist
MNAVEQRSRGNFVTGVGCRARHRGVSKVTVVVALEPLSSQEQVDDRTDVAGYVDFDISVEVAESAATVRVTGELDCYTAPQLQSALLALTGDGVRHVTVDIGGVRFIDSTGLSVLVGGLKRLRENDGGMVVKSPTAAARKLFEITGLTTVLELA